MGKTQNKRKEKRKRCYGKLFFLPSEIPAYIRDISVQGLRIDIPQPFEPHPDPLSSSNVRIIPEGGADFLPFNAEVEVRWISSDPLFTSMGARFLRIEEGKEESYRRLLTLYASHSSEEG